MNDRAIKKMLDDGCLNCGCAWEWRGLLPVCPECNDVPESHRPIGGKRPVYIQPKLFK